MILMFNPNAALMLISGLHGESFETKDRLTTQPDLLMLSQMISRSRWHNSWLLLTFFLQQMENHYFLET